MITQNELYDLGFAISLIRGNIKDPENVYILDSVLTLLKNPNKIISNNQIRNILRNIQNLSERWEFVKYDNYYVRTIIFKNEKTQIFLFENLSCLKLLLISQRFKQAFDLADILHILPDLIVENKGEIPKDFYKIFLNPYLKKWKLKS